MMVTKDVVRDLMPLYLAGEVSADTRRLVEEFLRAHPDENFESDAFAMPRVDPPAALETASLERTRRLFSHRSLALGAAFAVSYSVFTFRFGKRGWSFVLYRDLPEVAWVLLAAAAVIWMVFFALHRRWAATGLAGNTGSARGIWMAGGALAVLPFACVASYRFGLDDVRALCVAGAFMGAAIQRAMRRPAAG